MSTLLADVADAIQMNIHVNKKYFVFDGTQKYPPSMYSKTVAELGMHDQFLLSLSFGFSVTVDGSRRFFELTSCRDMNDFFFCIKSILACPFTLRINGEPWLNLRSPGLPLSSVFCSADVSISLSTGCAVVVHYRGAEYRCDPTRCADALVTKEKGVLVRLYDVVADAVGSRWPLYLLHKGRVVKRSTLVALALLKKEGAVEAFDLYVRLPPSVAIAQHAVTRQRDYGEDDVLRLGLTWPENLSDRDMMALFPQFMKVEAETDPACSVEVHGEELALFVPQALLARWKKMRATKPISVRPASFVICHRKILEEKEGERREKKGEERRKAMDGERTKPKENVLATLHFPSLGSRKKTGTHSTEEKPMLVPNNGKQATPNSISWKTKMVQSDSNRMNIKMPGVNTEVKVDKNAAKKDTVVTSPNLTVKKPTAGKNEKGNTRLAEPNRAEKKGVASAFPPLPSVALKEERKKDDKRLTKNWSTIVVVNSDNSAGKQKPSTSVKRSNPEKLQPREGNAKEVKQPFRGVKEKSGKAERRQPRRERS
ncbi:hypothetical protein WA577_004579 [Blastocystis sp. JDR]